MHITDTEDYNLKGKSVTAREALGRVRGAVIKAAQMTVI